MVLECCGDDCPWRVYAVKLKEADVFEIRKVVPDHLCTVDERGGYQTQATSSVIGELMRSKFGGSCGGPKPREIRQMMRGDHDYLVAKAARAFRLQEFYSIFNEIKTMDPKCAEYLLDVGVEHWARSHFSGNRYNVMTSNLAESWNSVLREAREYPVIPLIEFIRGKLTAWFASRREAAEKNSGALTPKVSGIVTDNFEHTGGYLVTMIAEDEYEVRNENGAGFHVDLVNKTCSCGEFQMLSIPCSHGIASAIKGKIGVDSLVSPAYTIEKLRSAYAGSVLPVPDFTGLSDLVTDFGGMRLCPPLTRRPPGRPKKQRFFSRGEKIVSGNRFDNVMK
ncbi:unnamed protein product [Brassica oleracea var. botrytis]